MLSAYTKSAISIIVLYSLVKFCAADFGDCNMAASGLMKVLASSKAWDASVPNYKVAANKMKFTHGFARDAWDAIVTDKTNIRVLDIACGTGALALPAADELQNTGGYVLATDFSPKMIESVEAAIKEFGYKNIEARVEDGQNLNIPDNSFDYAFSIMGFMFFPTPEKGFSEVFRVLKPGGKVAIATAHHQNTFIHVNTEILKRHNKPIHFEFLKLGNKEVVTKMYADAGFKDINVYEVTKDMPLTNHEQFVAMSSTNPGFVAVREELGMEPEEFNKLVVQVLTELFPNLPTSHPNTVMFGLATKP